MLTKVELPEKYTISLFIGGLKEEIAYAVRMFQPATLIDAFCLSKLQEANNSVSRSRSAPFLANPKNYGYANKYGGNGNGVRTTSVVPATTLPVTTNVMPNKPFKRLTQKELDEKRAKGQCFYCDKKYFPGHKCERQMFALEVSGMEEEEGHECLEEENSPDENEYLLPEEVPHISLNALSGIPTHNTMRVKGHILRQLLHILMDSGSTHNFLDLHTTKKLGCKLVLSW